MGSHVFFWEHPANEVYVTGTFDDWGKTVKLEKVGSRFEKLVQLTDIEHKIYYKYVVDGEWVLDHTDPQETDPAGNINNVLPPEHIQKNTASTDTGSSDLPGAFPETPAVENQSFGVNPLPASIGIGNPASAPAAGAGLPIQTKSIDDHVTLDKASYDNAGAGTAPMLPDVVTPEKERASRGGMFGLDSTPGAGTMIPESGLAMGAGAGAGLGAAALAESGPHISSVGPGATTAQLAGQVPFESERSAHISGISSDATTVGLAGQVPLENQVPAVVEKSQEQAHAEPEASANPEAVADKSAMEEELQAKVPEVPAASDSSISGKAAGIAAGAAATVTAAAAGTAAYLSSGKVTQDVKSALPVAAQEKIDQVVGNGSASNGTPIASTVPDTVQESISKAHVSPEAAANPEAVQEKSALESELLSKTHGGSSATGAVATAGSGNGTAIAPTVPDEVQESIAAAHVTPEAAANPEAVQEKSAVESELLQKVHPTEAAGEPAPTASAATATSAPAATGSSPTAGAAVASGVGASAGTAAVLAAISSSTSKTESASIPLAAPASAQAQTPATAATAAKSDSLAAPVPSTPAKTAVDSRDVSPMTRGPTDQTKPIVTTGVASATTEAVSTPTKSIASPTAASSSSTPASPASATADKKNKRKSGFFSKIKEKFEHRNDNKKDKA